MEKIKVVLMIIILFQFSHIMAQIIEPDFTGEAFVLNSDGSIIPLEKEIGDFTAGISFSSNSWNALSLEINGSESKIRFKKNDPLQIVIRAVDNNSDPLTIISIYKLNSKKKVRTVVLGEDNSGTLMKSRTNSKDMIRFNGKKYGESSYLLTLNNLIPGEYGIIVSNPNNKDEKRTIVSCFGIDK
jgi:hypothetical protein